MLKTITYYLRCHSELFLSQLIKILLRGTLLQFSALYMTLAVWKRIKCLLSHCVECCILTCLKESINSWTLRKFIFSQRKKKFFLHVLVPVCREAALMTRVGKRFTREMEVEKVGRDPRTEMEVWPLWEKRWKGGGLD